MKHTLIDIYKRLSGTFGPMHWWPARTSFEVIVGAILTQNTAWKNVEKAVANLKKEKLLIPSRLKKIQTRRLASLIRPAGYFNIKAKRLKSFMDFLFGEFGGSLARMFRTETKTLRRMLLGVKGIGPETADSILLYAGKRPLFVVDNYTKRIFSRHHILKYDANYDEVQRLFMANLPHRHSLFNEYHALIVKLGKEFCRKKPNCANCPLRIFDTKPYVPRRSLDTYGR